MNNVTDKEEIKDLAIEAVHDKVDGFLNEIKRLKETAKSPMSKLLSTGKGKEATYLDDLNPLWTGQMVVKAGHQLEQVREEICNYLYLDMDNHLISQESIDGVEKTVQDIFDGVLSTDYEAMEKGYYHYDLLLKQLDAMDYEYGDLWYLDDLKREAMVLRGTTKAFDDECHKIHAEVEAGSIAKHTHMVTKAVTDLIPDDQPMHPKLFRIKNPLPEITSKDNAEEMLEFYKAIQAENYNQLNFAKLNGDDEKVEKANKVIKKMVVKIDYIRAKIKLENLSEV